MRRPLLWVLVGALTYFPCATPAPAQGDRDVQRAAKVKRDINRIGVDEKVNVTLLDGARLKGRVSEIGEQYFVLTENKTADSRMITFAQVKKVGRVTDSPFSNPGTWIGLAMVPTIIGLCIWAKGVD